jgi:hypothetical protein
LLGDLLWHLRGLPPLGILGPGLRQKQLGTDWPVKRRAGGWIIGEILRADDHLATPNLTQRPGVLRSDSDRSSSFLWQAGIVEHEDAICHRMQGEETLHTRFVQLQRVPGRVSEQVLQAFDRGSGNDIRNGVTRLVRQISEQAGQITLHAVSARVSAKQRRKWLQKGRQFG